MTDITDYNTTVKPTWCPGCGNFGLLTSLKKATSELDLSPHELVLTYDIGCAGNMADKFNSYGLKTLHGRTVAVASGIIAANPELTVIATGGDGGIMEEGISHLLWAARSNYNITVIMHNNQRFALTTGQPTVTTEKGQPGKTAPMGIVENTILPAHMVMNANASFVARGFSGDPEYLVKIMKKAISHKGFAFVEVLQPCVTLNKINTFEWFKERVYKLSEEKDYDKYDWQQAFDTAFIADDKIATGVLYKKKNSISYSDRLPYRKSKKTTPVEEVKEYNISELIKEFK